MNTKQLLAGGALCALSFALVACGGNTSDASQNTPTPAPAAAPTSAQNVTQTGNTYAFNSQYSNVYEYTPKGAPDHLCVIVDKNDYRGGSAISCFLKTDATAPKQP